MNLDLGVRRRRAIDLLHDPVRPEETPIVFGNVDRQACSDVGWADIQKTSENGPTKASRCSLVGLLAISQVWIEMMGLVP